MSDTWIVGNYTVDLAKGIVAPRRGGGAERPDTRLMLVLKVLIDDAGQTISTETILERAWPDRVVSRDSVTTAVYQLRRLFGDSTDEPAYIASEPRRGYRLIATVRPAARWTPLRLAGGLAATLAIAAVAAWSWSPEPTELYVLPMQNYPESPVQEPLLSAIETTFLSELIQIYPGRVRIDDANDVALRLESMMVACDLGPTLVMRLLDTRDDTYVWSRAYNLDEVAASTERPTLVEQAALDLSAALH